MSWIKKIILFFMVFSITYIFGDNIINHYLINKINTSQMSISFRHTSNDDYISSPSENYIRISNDTLDQKPKRFRTGKYGEVLYNNFNKLHYKKDCKIVFLGGSSTETRWVDESKRWVALLDQKIQNFNKNAIALNFGVGGQNLAQSLVRQIAFISNLKPKMVFVMHEANDISKFLKGGYGTKEGSLHNLFDRKYLKKSIRTRLREILQSVLPFTTNLIINYKNKNHLPLRKRNKKKEYEGLDPHIAAKVYLGHLLALKNIVESFDGKLVFIEYPQIYKTILSNNSSITNKVVKDNLLRGLKENAISVKDFLIFHQKFKSTIIKGLQDHSVSMIQLPKDMSEKYFYDAVHFNEIGSIYFSKWIWKNIKNNLCVSH